MLLQSDRVVAPPGPAPDFESLARTALTERVENQWLKVPANQACVWSTSDWDDKGAKLQRIVRDCRRVMEQ